MVGIHKSDDRSKVLDITETPRDMHGSNGIAGEHHVMRHFMRLKTISTYRGVRALAQTGLQAFF